MSEISQPSVASQDGALSESPITPDEVTPTVPAPHPGVDDGTEVHGPDGQERVVFDYEKNEDGSNVLGEDGQPVVAGWHKETV